jgi:sulfate permease, SulP family
VLVGVLAVVVLGLEDKGVDVVGQIAGGLPSLGLPDASAPDYLALCLAAAWRSRVPLYPLVRRSRR